MVKLQAQGLSRHRTPLEECPHSSGGKILNLTEGRLIGMQGDLEIKGRLRLAHPEDIVQKSMEHIIRQQLEDIEADGKILATVRQW